MKSFSFLKGFAFVAAVLISSLLQAQGNTHGLVSWGWLGLGQSAGSPAPYRQVASNGYTTAAIRADGTVVCWGSNTNGQCSVPPGLTGVVQIAVGGGQMAAVKSDGTVVCWGANSTGESTVPKGLTGVVQVAAGGGFTVALKSNGTVVCWGDNSLDQTDSPKRSDYVQIASGTNHTVALMGDGSVIAWGYDFETGATNVPPGLKNVVQIAAWGEAGAAVMADGTMVKWGDDVVPVTPSLTGVVQVAGDYALESNGTVVNWTTVKAVPGFSKVVQIAGSDGVNPPLAALTIDGAAECAGDNTYGQSQPPVGLTGVEKVSTGYESMAMLLSGGTVVCRGINTYGEDNTPSGLTDVVDVRANGSFAFNLQYGTPIVNCSHTVALRSNGEVVCWGDNTYGQSTVPKGLGVVTQISAGVAHTAVLLSTGKVQCWGFNTNGECDVPATLPPIKEIAAGGLHTIALTTTGKVICWGADNWNQCDVPAGLTNVVHVAAGLINSAALEADGTLICWGNNAWGQSTVPAGLAPVLQVSAGTEVSIARTSTGEVVCLGGLLFGVTDFEEGIVPVGFAGAADVSAGYQQCAGISGVDAYFSSPYGLANTTADLILSLAAAPGSAGATVGLTSNSAQIQVATTAHLAAGVRTATVPVKIVANATDSVATIMVSYAGAHVFATLHLLPTTPNLSTVAFRLPTIIGGDTTICTVTLGRPVGTAGAEYTISSSSTTAAPAWDVIEVPAGEESFSFPVLTQQVASNLSPVISVYDGAVLVAKGTLHVITTAGVSFAADSVIGGLATTGTVRVPYPAPSGGQVIGLHSSSAGVVVPATVTVPYNATSVGFPIHTYGVNAATDVAIEIVNESGHDPSAILVVEPATISSVTVGPSVCVGQNTVKLTANLLGDAGSAGTTVAMHESSLAGGIPASVHVPAGKSTVSVDCSTGTVTASTVVTVEASIGTAIKETTFTVDPAPNKLTSFKVGPTSGFGGYPLTLALTFSGPSAPTGLTVFLSATPAAAMNLPASVTSAAGSTSNSTLVSSNGVTENTVVTLYARAGAVTLSTTYTVEAAQLGIIYLIAESSYHTTDYTTQGGTSVTGTVYANGEAPAAGITVDLKTSDPSLASISPTSVKITQGLSPTFTIITKAVTATTNVTISATSGSVIKTATLTLTKAAVSPSSLEALQNTSPFTGGETGILYLYPYGYTAAGFKVTLTSSDQALVPVPPSITIGQTGQQYGYLFITTGTVTKTTNVTVTATAGTQKLTTIFTLYPPSGP